MTIPYEAQRRDIDRGCGIAALAMVYRSFGIAVDQETIRTELRQYDAGRQGIRTFCLARHALERDLAAIPCRLKDPWNCLRTCVQTVDDADSPQGKGIRMILNHRVRPDSPLGHFTVFLGMDPAGETVRVHDPQRGPDRVFSRAELLELWKPLSTGSEITGNIAVLISTKEGEEKTCVRCGLSFDPAPVTPFPPETFLALFCPWCDAKFQDRAPTQSSRSPRT